MSLKIGVYWSPAVLEHKLERRHRPAPVEEVWNCRRLPQGMGNAAEPDQLAVASAGRWLGAFRLMPEVLYTPNDPACPYALIFDASSWATFRLKIACKPFRGWTYKVPDALFTPPPSLHSGSSSALPRPVSRE